MGFRTQQHCRSFSVSEAEEPRKHVGVLARGLCFKRLCLGMGRGWLFSKAAATKFVLGARTRAAPKALRRHKLYNLGRPAPVLRRSRTRRTYLPRRLQLPGSRMIATQWISRGKGFYRDLGIYNRGSEQQTNTRILHSGSKAKYKGDSRNVGSLCLSGARSTSYWLWAQQAETFGGASSQGLQESMFGLAAGTRPDSATRNAAGGVATT